MIADSQRRTSQIVVAYVKKNLIPTDQIAGLINAVHSTLSGLGNEVVEEPPRVPAVSIRRSVRPDYIICIECGYKGKMLKRHLQSRHGLSVSQYRSRWKLSSDYPTTAANYSERRSKLAKSIGLGRRPAQPATTRSRTSAKKASPKTRDKRASPKTRAGKTSPRTSAKKSTPATSAKKSSNRSRSRKSSFGATAAAR
jgi:predicted transcriptional regulator